MRSFHGSLFFALTAAVLAGCGQSVTIPSGPGGGDEDVPAFAAPVAYLKVAPGTGAATDAPFQAKFSGLTIVFNNGDEAAPEYMCEHDDPGVEEKRAENNQPSGEACALPMDASGPPAGAPGDPGTQSMPAGIDGTWSGYGTGGCGTWAVAQCNRILGDTDPMTPVSKEEWNGIAKGIHQNMAGGSYEIGRANYYDQKGYCTETKSFAGTGASYEELKSKLEDDHCDVKLAFYRRKADGTYDHGHVETVTAATNSGVITNSWGKEGVIVGGTNGGFKHSRGASFGGGAAPFWPANSTEVDVEYVCKCGAFDSLVSAMGL